MTHFYFVRHGQTEWNSIRKLQGLLDSPLTDDGIKQTANLSKVLPNVESVITSPLGRAKHTAALLVSDKCSITENNLIAEMSFGDVEGLEKEEFNKLYPREFYDLWHRADQYNPTAFNGESFESMVYRAKGFLKELKTDYVNKDTLIISHGIMLKVIMGVIWEHSLDKFWDDPVPLNTSITHVVLENNQMKIVDFSNVDHLEKTDVISYV